MRINEAGILLLTYADLQECGFSYHAIDKAKVRGIIVGTRAHNGGVAELQYESLPEKYKLAVIAKHGNPYIAAANQSMLAEYLDADKDAVRFYDRYQYESGERLDATEMSKCVQASTWMHLATALKHKMERVPRDVQKKLTANQWELFFAVLDKQEVEVKIPRAYSRLTRKVDEYYNKATGEYNYGCLVPQYKGKNNAAKVATEEQVALLKFLLSQHQNLPDTIVVNEYNHVAKANGWKAISANTVRNHRMSNAYLLTGLRQGKSEYIHKTRAQVKRTRPTMAGMMWATDGWTVELGTQNHTYENGKLKRNYFGRLELMAVVDPFNDYIIGFHIGKETAATIKRAVKDAVDKVYAVTGKYYLINELKKDRFGKGALDKWGKQATVYHREGLVGNSKDNPVERVFGLLNDQHFIYEFNWLGHGVTSKRQPNYDRVMSLKNQFPTPDEAVDVIRKHVADFNKTREAEWLESIKQMAADGNLVEIDRRRYLELFGIEKPKTIRAFAGGLMMDVNTVQYHYDLLDVGFRELIPSTNWIVKYDQNNLEDVLVTSEQTGATYLLYDKMKIAIPMAQMEMTEEHRHNLNLTLGYNSHHESLKAEELEDMYNTVEAMQPEFDRLMVQKVKPVIGGSQKKALQKAKNVIEDAQVEEVSTIRPELTDPEYWRKKALSEI